MQDNIAVWEAEGGSVSKGLANVLTGFVNQIEWAERIRLQVDGEFDRVARVLKVASRTQSGQARSDTQAIMGILEDKRIEVMEHQRAGYFIHDWQELRDQVRKMIMNDARYKALHAGCPCRQQAVVEFVPQYRFFEKFRDDIRRSFVRAHVEDRQNIGMVQRAGRALPVRSVAAGPDLWTTPAATPSTPPGGRAARPARDRLLPCRRRPADR